jgi:hypothetical protein
MAKVLAKSLFCFALAYVFLFAILCFGGTQ